MEPVDNSPASEESCSTPPQVSHSSTDMNCNDEEFQYHKQFDPKGCTYFFSSDPKEQLIEQELTMAQTKFRIQIQKLPPYCVVRKEQIKTLKT